MLECKYYLQQYATDSVTVGWYQRHGCLKDALKYILSQVRRAFISILMSVTSPTRTELVVIEENPYTCRDAPLMYMSMFCYYRLCTAVNLQH